MLRLMVMWLSRPWAVLACVVVVAACSDSSGCGDFRVTSKPMQLGSAQEVEVEVSEGVVPGIDVNGGIYLQSEGSPRLSADDGVHRATVRRTRDGLRMTVGEQTLRLAEEPIGCD